MIPKMRDAGNADDNGNDNGNDNGYADDDKIMVMLMMIK